MTIRVMSEPDVLTPEEHHDIWCKWFIDCESGRIAPDEQWAVLVTRQDKARLRKLGWGKRLLASWRRHVARGRRPQPATAATAAFSGTQS
jgi:hypothetical protein